MKVTILIPVFNEENTIIEILNRVNSEKRNDTEIEIVVVDDCSTDNSKKLLKENTELFDKLVELDSNLGKGGAVREGLKHSTGDYVLFQSIVLKIMEKYLEFCMNLMPMLLLVVDSFHQNIQEFIIFSTKLEIGALHYCLIFYTTLLLLIFIPVTYALIEN